MRVDDAAQPLQPVQPSQANSRISAGMDRRSSPAETDPVKDRAHVSNLSRIVCRALAEADTMDKASSEAVDRLRAQMSASPFVLPDEAVDAIVDRLLGASHR